MEMNEGSERRKEMRGGEGGAIEEEGVRQG